MPHRKCVSLEFEKVFVTLRKKDLKSIHQIVYTVLDHDDYYTKPFFFAVVLGETCWPTAGNQSHSGDHQTKITHLVIWFMFNILCSLT